MNVKRGEIYYISKNEDQKPCGSEQYPGRPAIIVSNNENNAFSRTFEVVYLTTQPKSKQPTHCKIYSANRISTALCEQVTTVSTERVGDYLGSCTDFEMQKVDRCIKVSLGLSDKEEVAAEDLAVEQHSPSTEELIKVTAERDIYKNMYESLLMNMGVKV